MLDLLQKCSNCGALIDDEDLFCANCGTEAPPRQNRSTELATSDWTHNFECQGCGASMSYDASAQTLRCPFCGSERMDEQQDAKLIAPQRVVPFDVERQEAEGLLRRWLSRGFWRPTDVASSAVITKMMPIYVPYWIFTAKTFTYWTADTNQTPPGARGDWFPVAGQHQGHHETLPIAASSALAPSETTSIGPFDFSKAVPASNVQLDNCVVEQFRVRRKYARPLARGALEQVERQACAQYVPGRSRNIHVNVRLEQLSSLPVLLPLWIMAYRYRNRVYRFVVNGQTGRFTGLAPVSWTKLWILIAAVVGVVILGLICAGIFSAVAAM